ncbi:ATP-binding protein [Aquincola sp. MAHUQ-54]|uniref:histidine kinase n=1 Tax=Aquincola agrisoli TaxID=3119538 RepID=A0AAW9QB30_9BURK
MSLQRRLLLSLLLCAPLVWALAMLVSVDRARHEVDELYDSELIRLAREVQSTLVMAGDTHAVEPPAPRHGASEGAADLGDLAIAVWDGQGSRILNDREGAQLRHLPDAVGFVDQTIDGSRWRIYYLQSSDGSRLVAAGQRVYERDEVVAGLTLSQLVPWLLMMPVLLVVMAWAVRRALAPVHALADDLKSRAADDLAPLAAPQQVPVELAPLVVAINGSFGRVAELLMRERRFVADAAHELRTPLATLRAQWEVVRRSRDVAERTHAEARLDAGLERMDRLVTQLLALSRAESADAALLTTQIDWPGVVERVMNDCLALAQRRRIELACEWPAGGRPAMPLRGDPQLIAVVLRNLLDNAVRYAPEGSAVTLRMEASQLVMENAGEPLPDAQLAALGQRFHRPPGQLETGSGLGISIVQRIADLHGLVLRIGAGEGGRGVRAVLAPKANAA